MKHAVKAAIAVAEVGVLTLAGCGAIKDRAVRDLKADNAVAVSNLGASRSLSMTWRLVDPDGSLKKAAVHAKNDPLTPQQADAVFGSSITVTVSRNSAGGLLGAYDLSAVGARPSAGLKQVNLGIAVRTRKGVLSDLRLVNGTLYFRTGWAAVQQMAELDHRGGAAEMDRALTAFTSESPEVGQALNDLRAGRWLRLPVASYLDQFADAFAARGAAPMPLGPSQADITKFLDVMKAAVSPHVTLKDLTHTGDRRTVNVEVHVKAALEAVAKAAYKNRRVFPFLVAVEPYDSKDLADLSKETVHGVVTIDHGHYTQLRLPLRDFFALDAHPDPSDPKPEELGKSALLLDVADRAAPITAPRADEISTVDVGAILEEFFQSMAGSFGQAFGGMGALEG